MDRWSWSDTPHKNPLVIDQSILKSQVLLEIGPSVTSAQISGVVPQPTLQVCDLADESKYRS